jgi:hypothetical protein
MSDLYGPGTYVIQLNGSDTPSLYKLDGTPLDGDPQFQTTGNASLFFQIFDARIAFDEEPIIWQDDLAGDRLPQPAGNGHVVDETSKVLALNVIPSPLALVIPTYHFKLRVKVDDKPELLRTPDGSRVVDPTIIERPPE